ncbi:hypothetical protein LMH87_000077 [Akanthomyces muscarius]|uniref:2EXR domain-containing protein n=1 Tax=Akanthomyces muscarius TaxID=2231603 RepID=A0A9W8QFI1_AKAMU|nr:hypothetical protein LMH87_000077 [Akanthomyces muscarius]KAJ4154801.1 hypothetical protein LMH87_000077 [Akanthomyces muscarius]
MCKVVQSYPMTMAESVPNEEISFPFDRLLPEIQLLVLEAALPSQRIFHVSDATKSSFTFYIRHPPPAVLSVCHMLRTAILRHGAFLDGAHGAFFLPAIDMLYFDRSHRRHFHRLQASSSANDRWATIQHVGLEWRALFARTPRLRPGEDFGSVWRAALAPLRVRMPALQSVTYVLPMVRHPGGLTWGREPYGAQLFAPGLVTLPEETKVPWGDALVMDKVPQARARGRRRNLERVALTELLLDGRKSYLVPWGEMKRVIEEALDREKEEDGERKEQREQESDWQAYAPGQDEAEWRSIEAMAKKDWPKLDLKGCWLLRESASYDEDVTSFPN